MATGGDACGLQETESADGRNERRFTRKQDCDYQTPRDLPGPIDPEVIRQAPYAQPERTGDRDCDADIDLADLLILAGPGSGYAAFFDVT